MKIALTLNWTTHYAEVTSAELDTLNKVLSRVRQVKDEGTVGSVPVLDVSPQDALDYRIRVLPDSTQVNQPEEN